MGLHLPELLVCKGARLVEEGVRDLDLANVVEGRGVGYVLHKGVGELLFVDALPPHLLHDDPGIGGGLAHVVPRALVPALHHVGQHQNEAVLHFGDDPVLVVDAGDVPEDILRGLGEGAVEVFDLVACANVQIPEAAHTVLPGLLAVVGEFSGGRRHGVDRPDDVVLRQVQSNGQGQDEEAEEEGDKPGKVAALRGAQPLHGDIHRRVALADAVASIHRLCRWRSPDRSPPPAGGPGGSRKRTRQRGPDPPARRPGDPPCPDQRPHDSRPGGSGRRRDTPYPENCCGCCRAGPPSPRSPPPPPPGSGIPPPDPRR